MAEHKVTKIGWESQNPMCPIVLLRKKDRRALGVELSEKVEVNKVGDTRKVSCVVWQQFKEFINDDVATLNIRASESLGVKLDDSIDVAREVATINESNL